MWIRNHLAAQGLVGALRDFIRWRACCTLRRWAVVHGGPLQQTHHMAHTTSCQSCSYPARKCGTPYREVPADSVLVFACQGRSAACGFRSAQESPEPPSPTGACSMQHAPCNMQDHAAVSLRRKAARGYMKVHEPAHGSVTRGPVAAVAPGNRRDAAAKAKLHVQLSEILISGGVHVDVAERLFLRLRHGACGCCF
jgi:hypothetical protein